MHIKTRTQVIHPEYHSVLPFIDTLPETFDTEGETLHQGRNVVKRFRTGAVDLVVKRYKRPNIIQRIAYTYFEASKAERAFRFAAILRSRGIDTPHEVAYIERTRHGLLLDSYFVCLSCNKPSLFDFLQRPDFDHGVAKDLAHYIAYLHDHDILHGDLNLGNILFERKSDGHCAFSLIDTNRSKFRHPSRKDCLRNILRLTYDRALMAFVTEEYARTRGWDTNAAVSEELQMLQQFWNKNARKWRIKHLLKRN